MRQPGRRARVPHRSKCTRRVPGPRSSTTGYRRARRSPRPGTTPRYDPASHDGRRDPRYPRRPGTGPAYDVDRRSCVLAYVPFLLSSPGRLSSDTKQYLYLDPGRFLARVPWLWDPHVAAGTVPHQQLGYLFPMGPVLLARRPRSACPDWIAQRLWLGTISLVGRARRALAVPPPRARPDGARSSAALVYVLTPYQLAFTARISVLLLPWAALPWIVGLTMRAVHRGRLARPGRDRARSSSRSVASTRRRSCSSALAPALWIALELCGGARPRRGPRSRRPAASRCSRSGSRRGGSRASTSRARAGCRSSSSPRTCRRCRRRRRRATSSAGSATGSSTATTAAGPSLVQSPDYVSNSVVVVASYLVPALAFLAAGLVRWRHRVFCALCVVVGTVVGVGAWPYDDTTPWGALWKRFTSDTSAGLALRNSPRVVPVVVLGVAGLVGAGVERDPSRARPAGSRRSPSRSCWRSRSCPVWRHGYLTPGVERPERHPGVLEGRDPRPRRRRPPDADPRGPGLGVRHLPVGQHGRADHAGPHHPALHRP